MGPRRGVDTITPHTRPPADEDADRALVRVVTCMDGVVEATDTLTTADATGGDVRLRLQTDMALGAEGGRVRARHALRAGERLFCSLSWAEELASPVDADEAEGRLSATCSFWRDWLDRSRPVDHR